MAAIGPSTAFPHGIPADIVAEGQSLLDDRVTLGEKKDNFVGFLLEHHLARPGTLHTDLTLTHPKNRGKLLLNPFNCHRNGSLIRRVGANMAELHQAMAFEMHPDWRVRQDTSNHIYAPSILKALQFQTGAPPPASS